MYLSRGSSRTERKKCHVQRIHETMPWYLIPDQFTIFPTFRAQRIEQALKRSLVDAWIVWVVGIIWEQIYTCKSQRFGHNVKRWGTKPACTVESVGGKKSVFVKGNIVQRIEWTNLARKALQSSRASLLDALKVRYLSHEGFHHPLVSNGGHWSCISRRLQRDRPFQWMRAMCRHRRQSRTGGWLLWEIAWVITWSTIIWAHQKEQHAR